MTKRVKIVEFAEEDGTMDKLFQGNIAVIAGLPDDVTIRRYWEEPARQTHCFLLESEEFPPVEQGEVPPKEDIVIAERRVNKQKYWVCHNCLETTAEGDVVGRNE